MVEKPEGLPRCLILQTDQGKILRGNFSHLHKAQAGIKHNSVVVLETKLMMEQLNHQVPAQAQSPLAPIKSFSVSTHSQPDTASHLQMSNLAQPATAPQSSRFARVIKLLNRLDL